MTKRHRRVAAILLIAAFVICLFGCSGMKKTVVVYTSVDQVYSEPIFALFEEKTGIKVKAVYDIEASKTVGLANRLVSERDNPQADVFWSGEILQTIDLKEKDVLAAADPDAADDLPSAFVDPDGTWFGFGGRARVLIYNKTLISAENCPKTMEALAAGDLVTQTAIANPVFGTTSTHAAALYAFWGNEAAKAWFVALRDGGAAVLEGNSVVKDYVSAKKLAMGLTDTDDAFSEMKQNKDLDILLLDQGDGEMGALVIPNTAALIQGAPHPETAKTFLEFLLSAETEQSLVDSGWIHIPVHEGVTPSAEFHADSIRIMEVSFADIYQKLEQSKNDMTNLFVTGQ